MARLGVACREAFEVFSQNETLRLQRENNDLRKKLAQWAPPDEKIPDTVWWALWAGDDNVLWQCVDVIEWMCLSPPDTYIKFYNELFPISYALMRVLSSRKADAWANRMAEQLVRLVWDAINTVDERELLPPHNIERPLVMTALVFPWLEQVVRPQVVSPTPEPGISQSVCMTVCGE